MTFAGLTRSAALRSLGARLAAVGIESPTHEARLLVGAASGVDHAGLVRDPDVVLDATAGERLDALAKRRLAGEPVTRILGVRHFWSLELKVTPDVLDPRADSETLVEAVLRHLGERRHAPLQILDLGTGSGALLLSLLADCPNAFGVGVDVSFAACEVARHNASVHGLDVRAEIKSGNWTDGLDRRFDVVVSNPPYIPSVDLRGLDRAVRDHDPALALDGGLDGLDAYRSIIARAPDVLAPGGIVALELGIHQAPPVAALAAQSGLTVVDLRRDLAGIQRAMVLVRDKRLRNEGASPYTSEKS